MISLIFKILADATNFNSTLKRQMPRTAQEAGKEAGKKGGEVFGKEFGQQVKGAILASVGVGAIAAAIKKAVDDAASIAKDAATSGASVEGEQVIARIAKITGMTAEDVRKNAASDPSGFMAIAKRVEEAGVLSSEQIGKINEGRSLFDEAKTKLGTKLALATSGGVNLADSLLSGVGGGPNERARNVENLIRMIRGESPNQGAGSVSSPTVFSEAINWMRQNIEKQNAILSSKSAFEGQFGTATAPLRTRSGEVLGSDLSRIPGIGGAATEIISAINKVTEKIDEKL